MQVITTTNQKVYPVIEAGYNGLSELTRQAYKKDLDIFNSIINKDIQEITPDDILSYIRELKSREYKNSTINRKIYSLSKILNLYRLQGLIKSNVISELNKIRRITKPVENNISNDVEVYDIQNVMRKKNRTTLIIKALMSTGMRISELINIKNENIKSYSKEGKAFKKITITGKGNKDRDIFITAGLYQDIKDIFGKSRQGFLFQSKSGKPLNRINLYKQIKQVFRKYTGKEINPHLLRHFYGDQQINVRKRNPKAVSKYMGHSSINITYDYYVKKKFDNPALAILTA